MRNLTGILVMSKKNKIKIPRVMYIFCEGEKTEPLYLESYISDISKKTLSVFKIPKTKRNTPEQLVDAAIQKKQSSSSADGDVFWVVYDQENLTPQAFSAHQRAWSKANKHGVNIAISCICFEFWLLLHFGYTTKAFTSYSNLMSASPLKKLLPDYDKGSKITYMNIKDRVSNAKINATKLKVYAMANNKKTTQPYSFPAYTSFHELLEAIDSF